MMTDREIAERSEWGRPADGKTKSRDDGVQLELHNYPGTVHGFDFLTPSDISTRAVNEGIEAFKRAVAGYAGRLPLLANRSISGPEGAFTFAVSPVSGGKMKKLLLDIHLYLGLVCASYLVIYGISTIAFNHYWRPEPVEDSWEAVVKLPAGLEGEALGQALRDSLGLVGWTPRWRIRKTDEGFRLFVGRPGREYDIHLNTGTGHVRVDETDRGLLGIVCALHGLRSIPGSTWSHTWAVYSEISIWALVFSALSGVYFWWLRVPERRVGWWLIGLGSGGSILFMLYMAL